MVTLVTDDLLRSSNCNGVAIKYYFCVDEPLNYSEVKNNSLRIIGGTILVSLLFSCEKDKPVDPIIPNEGEVITTLTYTLVPDGGGDTAVFTFQDLDGDGGNPPIITGATLQANTTYTGTLQLLNQLASPTEDINEEILEEADEHQFFFQTTLDGLNISYADSDEDGNPVGLSTVLTTTSSGSGMLTIILRHEPDKGAEGVASGNLANAGGETDIEVIFDVEIQ